MIHAFSMYIRNIAVFLIFTTFTNIIIPDIKYKNYINLALGFVMIFIILSPIKAMFTNPEGGDIGSMLDNFTNQLNANATLNKEINYEGSQNQLILSTYEASLNDQVKTMMDKDETFVYENSSIDVDDSDDRFGDIKAIHITVREKTEQEKLDKPESASKPLIRIETIKIDTNSIFSSKYKPNVKKDDEIEEIKNLKILFSDFYNLSYDNIYITVQKKN